MRIKLLFFLAVATTMMSQFAMADDYAYLRNRAFVLEKSEFMDDMYSYLVCLLNKGDRKQNQFSEVVSLCKNSHIQYLVLEEASPTEQVVYTSLKPYGFQLQTMILCLARGGARSSRASTNQVIDYCDKVTAPLD